MVILECTKVCVCSCCGGHANRLECTCPCNKCTCARSRHKRKQDRIAGIEKPKKPKNQLPKQQVIKFVEITCSPRNTNTSTKLNQQDSILCTTASVSGYPKEVAEQTFVFCYDEEMESRSIAEQTPSAKVPRPTPNSTWKGMRICLHECSCACICKHVWVCVCTCVDLCVRMCGVIIINYTGTLYGKFASAVTEKVVRCRDNMWCMPAYNPETAALSVCLCVSLYL
jgi:hypothetical protein